MLNASVGVQRVIGRLRRPRAPPERRDRRCSRSVAAARRVRAARPAVAPPRHRLAPAHARRRPRAPALVRARSADRARSVPTASSRVAVAGILLGASSPASRRRARPVAATAVRPAAATDVARRRRRRPAPTATPAAPIDDRHAGERDPGPLSAGVDSASRRGPVDLAGDAERAGAAPDSRDRRRARSSTTARSLKPVAVDTTVADGAGLMQPYRVASGDTLTGIAAKFDVSMMTVWWANDLKTKDDLQIGQKLTIPPVSGLVVTVRPTDTLDTLAARYNVDAADDRRRPTASRTRTSSSARSSTIPGAQGAADPDAQADAAKRPTAKPAGTRPTAVAAAARRDRPHYTRRPVRLAGRRRRQLHQPVLPLRPLRDRHRRRHGDAGLGGRRRHGRSSPAGRATAAATRSGSPTAPACTRPTTTCRRSRSGAASTSAAASRSGGSG